MHAMLWTRRSPIMVIVGSRPQNKTNNIPPPPHPPHTGHLKTVLILVLGVVLFNSAVDLRQTLGIVVAMAGVVSYTEVKRRQATHRPAKLPR
jgi:hypothetical protein